MSSPCLHGVYTGQPKPLGIWKTREIVSAIDKQLLNSPFVNIHSLGIEGDGQADLKVHGGTSKAIYAYPMEHYQQWNTEIGTDFVDGDFGENLAVSGLLETNVCVGDLWQIGDVLLEVTKPRQPCYKLIMHSGVDDIIQRMRANRRCGWYLQVIKPGLMPTSSDIRITKDNENLCIDEVYASKTKGPIKPAFFG